MKELIKIEKQLVGAEEVNTVNARELHEELGVKKQFSEWINHQINSLGLEKNIDYVVSEIKVVREVGASKQKNYILTLDTAKHIAMASRTAKGKEVRAYFIAIEKEFKAAQVPHGEMNSVIPVLQMMVKQQDSMLEILRMLAQNQTAMMEQQQMILQRQEAYERPMALPSTLSLTPEQLGKIRGAVNMAAEAVLLCFENDNLTRVQKLIYTKLNNALGTPSYIYIPAIAFNEALEIIKEIERKHITLFEEREAREKKMDASINGVDSLEVPQF